MTLTNEDIFNMTVPLGEACGCYEDRGCLDSIYCTCNCKCCHIQRDVDADIICGACRNGAAVHSVNLTNYLGDDEFKQVCESCYKTYRAELGYNDYVEDVEDVGYLYIIDEGNESNDCPPDCDCDSDSTLTCVNQLSTIDEGDVSHICAPDCECDRDSTLSDAVENWCGRSISLY